MLFMKFDQPDKFGLYMAERLNDIKSLTFYIRLAHKYNQGFLMEKLEIVLNTPEEKIKKSRAAYFTYLITQYADARKYSSRH